MAPGAAALSYGCSVLLLGAYASWVPRPLRSYEVGLPEEDAELGVQRFSHAEQHRFEDGSELQLNWEVDANPDTILALDLEHPHTGARIVECKATRLSLRLPEGHLGKVTQWRHVTASDHLHGCKHLLGKDLYHRVVSVEHVTALAPPHQGALAVLNTQELASASHMFSHCHFSYSFMPVEAREDYGEAQAEVEEGELHRRLAAAKGYADVAKAKPFWQSSLKPDAANNHGQSILNLNVPDQNSQFGWNWNYYMNTTRNPQFKYTFPGGIGYMRLYAPYLKANIGITMNHTSKLKGFKLSPQVTIDAQMQGVANFNADIAAAVKFNTDRSASMLDNVLDRINISGFPNFTADNIFHKAKFFMGGTPLSIEPKFECKLKAYHLGLLNGTMRVGLATKLLFRGIMSFDTNTGLQTNFSAKALDVKFTPPTWMIFTKRFELGMMFEPTASVKGGFGEMQDMEMGWAFRPYFNVSIQQEGLSNLSAGSADDLSDIRQLAILPYRAVGLPDGKSYSIRVGANGVYRDTSIQTSTGTVEFSDNVNTFEFGSIAQDSLVGAPIEVQILEDGQALPVANGTAVCTGVVNGMCTPSPVSAKMLVEGKEVIVQLSVVWQDNAIQVLESKVQSLSLRFPSVTISSASVRQQLASPQVLATTILRLTHNGRIFNVPLAARMNSTMLLRSRVIFELGPSFLDSWKGAPMWGGDKETLKPLTPTLELVVNGVVVGKGTMPPVSWDRPTSVTKYDNIAEQFRNQLQSIPVMVPLYDPMNSNNVMGTGEIEIDLLPASKSAFWILPYQADLYNKNQAYTFYWTTHGATEGIKYNFTLTAMEVGASGELTSTNWQQPAQVGCSKTSDATVHAWTGGVPPCIFKYQVTISNSLTGTHFAMIASWLDAQLRPHWMMSPVVGLGARRRLDSANAGMWGAKALGSTNSTTFNSKVRSKLDKMKSHCNANPLKYHVGAGVNFVEHMKNVMLPMGAMGMGGGGMDSMGMRGGGLGGMGGMGSSSGMSGLGSPDWTSKPIPIYKLGGKNGAEGEELSSILPKSLCAGGVCEGMMPGCQKTRVNPINIKQIVFKLSRLFKYKEHFGPKMRHIIAYGLTLFPSAINVAEKSIIPDEYFPTTAGPKTSTPVPTMPEMPSTSPKISGANAEAPSRRLNIEEEIDGDADHEADDHDDTEFNQFTVRITQPMHYELTEELLRTFLVRGAFRGISDGRENTHGPMEVVDVSLREPLAMEHMTRSAPPMPHAARGGGIGVPQPPPVVFSAAVVLAGACALSAGVMLFIAIRRRWDYALLSRTDVVVDTQGFA
mmetsp:Transcript_12886/g.28711  ORF Transcript_12886/g.28711 Transcript_12886/m.28711 type:complete len:1300 (+) Transcript_12886:61-3960(+)